LKKSKGKDQPPKETPVARQERRALLQPDFLQDLSYWAANDQKTAVRLLRIMAETLREPFKGIGKPEPLKSLGASPEGTFTP
jgi:hypothetical protein